MGLLYVIGGTKGGSSKSTLCCHLAVMRALAGKRVCIYDLDRQRSSFNFGKMRASNEVDPAIRYISGFMDLMPGDDPVKLGRALIKDLRDTAQECDDVIVDCGGSDNPALRFAMMVADRMMIPLAPAQFDVWALHNTSKMLNDIASTREDEFRPIIIPSLVSPQTNERMAYKDVQENYPNFDWAPDGVMMSVRSAFRRTLGEGIGLFDLEKQDTKARQELLGVYHVVFGEDWMKRSKNG